MKKIISLALTIIFALSFTAFADLTDLTYVSSTIKDGASAVYVKEGKISITFNSELIEEPEEGETVSYTASAITMTEDETAFEGFSAVINSENRNVIDITFDGDLNYAKTYVIDFSTLVNKYEIEITGKSSISFTTEPEPAVKLSGITHSVGIGNVTIDGDAVDGGTVGITATVLNLDGECKIAPNDNLLQGFKVELKNIATEIKTVNIICAIYDSNNIIKRVLISSKDIASSSTDAVELGTIIDGATFEDGYVKIYIWDSIENKSPFVGSTKINITIPSAE